MKTNTLIILSLIFILIVGLLVYIKFKGHNTFGQPNKKEIVINNIYKDNPKKITSGSVTFRDNNYYTMYYNADDQSFAITINNQNLNVSRKKAEEDFLEILGINKEEACQMDVSLVVTYNVNQKAAGQNYRLSFCPNGLPLP
jgi:hypothetical protein